MKQSSAKSKVSEAVESALGLLQVIAYVVTYIFFLVIVGNWLSSTSLGEDTRENIMFGVVIGTLVLIGWAVVVKNEKKND